MPRCINSLGITNVSEHAVLDPYYADTYDFAATFCGLGAGGAI